MARAEERQNLEAAMQRIRDEVRGMEAVDDWEKLFYIVAEELNHIGISFQWASVLLADLEDDSMRGFGFQYRASSPYRVSKRPLRKAVRQAVASDEVVYRPDLEADDPFGELEDIQRLNLRCVVDVPFRNGTIGLSHREAGAFTEEQIAVLLQIAEILSDGVQRVEDLRHLEQRNLELEQEIAGRRRLEQELIRVQRLRAVGELSAGISHNLNNILTGVLGPAQLLERMTDDPEMLFEVKEIIASARRARDLVLRLHLSVSGMEEETLGPVRLDAAIEEAVQTTRLRWKDESEARGVSIQVIVRRVDVPPIRGTPSGMRDLLTHLLLNAVEAMPRGGGITIETRQVGEQVLLTFADDGIGMEEETRQRVFEPFFTTKKDVGSGLGLSMAYGTVNGWGGSIEVESAPGEGAVFSVRLPLWEEEPSRSAPPASQERLLVVDDEDAVPQLLGRLLGRKRLVEMARDGREALERFAAGGYDAVLVDLAMPGFPGDQLARELRRIDPAVATVLITGRELSEGGPWEEAFDFLLRKPFDDLELVEEVIARAVALRRQRASGAPDVGRLRIHVPPHTGAVTFLHEEKKEN